MLDNRTDVLLNFINNECSEGSFKIFSPSELMSAFPERFAIDFDGLLLILDYLGEREYIVVKYADENAVCLSPLPKGRIYHEEREAKDLQQQRYARLVYVAFFGALGGAACGSFFTALLRILLGV